MSVGGQSVSAYVILAGNTQLAIDVPGASGAPIRLQLFPLHGGANQVWGLVPYLASGSMLSPPFGPVLLVNKSSGLYLGTEWDGFGSNVLQRSYHERSCCWRIDLR